MERAMRLSKPSKRSAVLLQDTSGTRPLSQDVGHVFKPFPNFPSAASFFGSGAVRELAFEESTPLGPLLGLDEQLLNSKS